MKIAHKLFLILVGFITLVLVVTLLMSRWSFQQGFTDFMEGRERQRLSNIADSLMVEYVQSGNNWQFLRQQRFARIINMHAPRGPIPHRPPPPRRPRLSSERGPGLPTTALFDVNGEMIAGERWTRGDRRAFVFPIVQNGETLAKLHSWPAPVASDRLASAFIRQQVLTSIGIGLLCLVIAIFVSWGLTQQLLKPVQLIHRSIQILTRGDFKPPSLPTRTDELGSLMRNVEGLANTLDKTRETKNRWFASISHELRTPLTVLKGEVEAMQAGLRQFDQSSLASLQQEIQMLEHLVNDLYQLSLADIGGLNYTFENVDFVTIVEAACDALFDQCQAKGLALHTQLPSTLRLSGDAKRLSQLLLNLLNNALLYTDAPGSISVTLSQSHSHCLLSIEDTPPGVSASHCELLFEPLYRCDAARTRKGSGAGLGLAICKNIVDAHQGTIEATPGENGGLLVNVTLALNTH